MPKKPGKKSTNKDSKKVKNVTKTTDKDIPIDEQLNSKPNESKLQANPTSVRSGATVSTELTFQTDPEIVVENRKYSKRKIQSNWQRYEIPNDSSQFPESATTRGYDFELVKNTDGGVGSHFQFQDERDWEDELNSDSESMNQLQSLDLNSLALSLSCIPFHHRLGIDPKYFTDEQICKFEAAAQLQRVKYQSKSLTSDKQDRKTGNVKPAQTLASLYSPVETLNVVPMAKNNARDEAVTSVKLQDPLPNISKVTQENETPIDNDLEDELDALLALNRGKVQNMRSIDIPPLTLAPGKEHPTVPIVKPVLEITAISGESLDDWLDSALEN